jgi:hypothetical protein
METSAMETSEHSTGPVKTMNSNSPRRRHSRDYLEIFMFAAIAGTNGPSTVRHLRRNS